MSLTCLKKQKLIKEKFSSAKNPEALYHAIMEMGRELEPFDSSWKTDDKLVPGCQSKMYLHVTQRDDNLHFFAASDALISAGLAALLLAVYNDETPEVVLTCEPEFLSEIGLFSALTPGRSNGLSSLYLKMKQLALSHLVRC